MYLRDGQNEDRFFLADVCRSVAPMYDFMPGAFEKQADKYEKALPSHYRLKIIEDSEKKIGFIGYKIINEDIVYLLACYIHDDYQRSGYGKKAYQLYEKHVCALGFKKTILQVHHKATWAISFYMTLGFVKAMIELPEALKLNDTLCLVKLHNE